MPRSKVTLALPEGALRARILELLEGSGVDVELAEPGDDLRELRDGTSDVVLVSDAHVDVEELDQLTEGDEPGEHAEIGVLGVDDSVRRAQMLAAGADDVIDLAMPDSEITSRLEILADEGSLGASGPDIRGQRAEPRLADFRTRSQAMRDFMDVVERVVPVDTALLITGPTGVGKERLARAIHAEGPRAKAPFVSINCGAMPEQLLESELFGHEKGSFTGADAKREGHFERASGGTVFLDEIGEMPMHLQVKLLTVLQGHEVVRLGSSTPVPVDVRVIAATNRDLKAEVEAGEFREDLLFRLNVVTLEIPALADRREDVPDLAGRFIAHFRTSLGYTDVATISDEGVQALLRYDWPGNVRELINVIERAMVLGRGAEIGLADLPPEVVGAAARGVEAVEGAAPVAATAPAFEIDPDGDSPTLKDVREAAVARAEQAYLQAVLDATSGQVGRTAKIAGIGPRALYDRMKRYGLDKNDFKD